MARRDLKPNEQDVYELLLSNINNLKLFDGVPDRTIQLIIDGVDDLEPLTFPYEIYTDVLREDEPCDVLDVEDVLKNAGSVKDNQIKLPKVIN